MSLQSALNLANQWHHDFISLGSCHIFSRLYIYDCLTKALTEFVWLRPSLRTRPFSCWTRPLGSQMNRQQSWLRNFRCKCLWFLSFTIFVAPAQKLALKRAILEHINRVTCSNIPPSFFVASESRAVAVGYPRHGLSHSSPGETLERSACLGLSCLRTNLWCEPEASVLQIFPTFLFFPRDETCPLPRMRIHAARRLILWKACGLGTRRTAESKASTDPEFSVCTYFV